MKIYYSCSVSGGRQDLDIFASMIKLLKEMGHTVPTEYLGRADLLALLEPMSDQEVFEQDVSWLKDSDMVVAEVSTPSHGVGYEIALALVLNKPVLCLYKAGVNVSKMISGNTHPNFAIKPYADLTEAKEIITSFINS